MERLAKVVAVMLAGGLLGVPVLMAEVTVSNVRASQRAGTKLVDIYYDLGETSEAVTVSLEGSVDGGTTWTLPLTSLSGAVGSGVSPGANRRVTWDGGADWSGEFSQQVRFRVTVSDLVPPGEFVMIPSGSFEMGDKVGSVVGGDGQSNELPVHSVYVSAFYMQNTEVTNDQMVEVLNWAYERGKVGRRSPVMNTEGFGFWLLDMDAEECRIEFNWDADRFEMKTAKGSGYPCVELTWWGAAAYCIFRSEMDGLTPCYSFFSTDCDFDADGYRLPTEAEWEKAARGGIYGSRFPWGDIINHDHANYRAKGNDVSYDNSTYTEWTYHPDWDDLGEPYTALVDAFAPNGYGLYNMAGNVEEYCNDAWDGDYYTISPDSDPVGPRFLNGRDLRVTRGGAWMPYGGAWGCRVAARSNVSDDASYDWVGFRPVRRPSPPE